MHECHGFIQLYMCLCTWLVIAMHESFTCRPYKSAIWIGSLSWTLKIIRLMLNISSRQSSSVFSIPDSASSSERLWSLFLLAEINVSHTSWYCYCSSEYMTPVYRRWCIFLFFSLYQLAEIALIIIYQVVLLRTKCLTKKIKCSLSVKKFWWGNIQAISLSYLLQISTVKPLI